MKITREAVLSTFGFENVPNGLTTGATRFLSLFVSMISERKVLQCSILINGKRFDQVFFTKLNIVFCPNCARFTQRFKSYGAVDRFKVLNNSCVTELK